MKIALIGYGKMGHIIESIAHQRGHEIVCIIDQNNTQYFTSEAFASADVAIEFTTPQTAAANILRAWKAGVPVVCGTTGWDVNAIKQITRKGDNMMDKYARFRFQPCLPLGEDGRKVTASKEHTLLSRKAATEGMRIDVENAIRVFSGL